MSGAAARPFPASIALSISSFFLFLLSGGLLPQAIGQEASTVESTPAEPAAFVYVSSSPSNSKVEINAFRAPTDGKLSIVPGSPFSTEMAYGASMAVNQKFLFATSGIDIYSFHIKNDGTLQQASSVNAQNFNLDSCGGPQALFLDRTGSSLYDLDYYSDCANNAYQIFSPENLTGQLSYEGVTTTSTPIFEVPLSFSGNNEYAYGASCYHWLQEIFGFKRSSDGNLTDLNITPAMPISKPDQLYCPNLAAADPTNHVAVPVQALNSFTLQPVGDGAIATYTADTAGNLTTASTYSNMPKIGVGTVTSISMSPSGNLLAVGGTNGLQIFHFNGAEPVTAYGGLLTTDEVDQISWDTQNRLYAISQPAGLLFVFRITPTSHNRMAGSPYAIANPNHIAVLPK
jgi:hypothetical protein